ncbi:glucose-6-phosphate dehydrogenase [bacterium J17]|nr:glucose-6-phosphate dehydrogenase [bacterium J17]
MPNPFEIKDSPTRQTPPCVVVIFGATGDLTKRKLVPALYNLSVDGLLPANFFLVNFARREYSSESFNEYLREGVESFSRRKPVEEAVWTDFSNNSHYVQGTFDEQSGYTKLRKLLDEIDSTAGQKCTRIFYLATAPDYFEIISKQLANCGLLTNKEASGDQSGGARVVVEKPFGRDLESAKALNKSLLECMSEEQIYRIDHYLGKETVQNLLVFRFANGIFEPIWNHKYIDHVQISVCESIGLGTRAGYFDQSGILRDIVQNHALQLLCLVALEPPVAFEANAVRDEKVKVLRSTRRLAPKIVDGKVVRARYQNGSVAGEEVQGYLAEPGVDPDSTTETYMAMELAIDSWRWSGVPFFIRAGKRLAKRVTDISIQFKNVPYPLFQDANLESLTQNLLSFQIQPDEGIALKVSSKPPGAKVKIQSVNMDFSYGTSFGVQPPEAYERLLLDCMKGDATLFTRNDEIEQAWELMAPILERWSNSSSPIYGYEAGTWGPRAADELLENKIGVGWKRL